MTGAMRLGLACAGLVALAAVAVPALRTEGPAGTARATVETPACSSCDARHARLRAAAPGQTGAEP